jgi:cation:H+ antiporter
MGLELALFAPCLLAVIAGSMWLSSGLEELGGRLAMLPALLGLIMALGADSPEIASAVTALVAGDHEVGVGVVLGSNLFNLAALMGVSPLLAKHVRLKRAGVIFNGAVSLLVTAIAAVLVLRALRPVWCMVLLGAVFATYVLVLWLHVPEAKRLPLPDSISTPLARIVGEVHEHARRKGGAGAAATVEASRHDGWLLARTLAGSLVLIVVGSSGLVHAALRMASAWAIPSGLVGALVLAALTSIPNTFTSARLARQGNGAAVVSETLNSNTINIVVGIGLPALVFGVSDTHMAILELSWLLGSTAVAVALAALGNGLTRPAGVSIIALYLGFVAMRVHLR